MTSLRAEPTRQSDCESIVLWLAAIGDQRDLGLTAPHDERSPVLEAFLAAVSAEFAAYAEIVARARRAAQANIAGLVATKRTASEQHVLIQTAAETMTVLGRSALVMADAADAMGGVVINADAAAGVAGEKLARIDGVLSCLADELAACNHPLREMVRLTNEIAGFPQTLARLSRHAQLLAVNASIEAAHLAEAGARFEIVAAEVARLAQSTGASKGDVAHIIGALRGETGHVSATMTELRDATGGAQHGVAGAARAVANIAAGATRLEAQVATVSDHASTQSTAAGLIGESVAHVAREAEAAAHAAGDTAHAHIDTLLESAEGRIERWRRRNGSMAFAASDDPFVNWIGALIAGAKPAGEIDLDHDPTFASLVFAVRALVERIDVDQRAILRDVIDVAIAVARNGFTWDTIDTALAKVGDELLRVREMVGTAVDSARTFAGTSNQIRGVVSEICGQYDTVLDELAGALALVERIGNRLESIVGFVEAMTRAVAQANEIIELIETLSSETELLSLNAAIEAAHAGNLGLGFGVIADGIRSLAGATNESTRSVSLAVSTIADVSQTLQTAIAAAGARTGDVVSGANAARSSMATLQTAFAAAEVRARDVAESADAQSSVLASLRDAVERTSSSSAGGHEHPERLDLVLVGSAAHAVAARRPMGTAVADVRAHLEVACREIEAVFERVLTQSRLSFEQLFTFAYTPITGDAIAKLGRLFDVSQVPLGGFEPAKFATPWDAAVDEELVGAMSRFWDAVTGAAFLPVASGLCDLNGFFIAYPCQQIAAWTGDPMRDLVGNRIKRILEDAYSLRVARTGLGPHATALGKRCTLEQFRAAGCELERVEPRAWGAYIYARETKAVLNDVAAAVYIRGNHHCTLRLLFDPSIL